MRAILKKDRFAEANGIIKQFIHLRPYLAQKIESFYQKNMAGKKIIGIHLRGTDKKIEVLPVNIQEMLNDANKLALQFTDCQFSWQPMKSAYCKQRKRCSKEKSFIIMHIDPQKEMPFIMIVKINIRGN